MKPEIVETAKAAGVHPVFIFIGMLASVITAQNIPVFEFPVGFIQGCQIFAYISTGLVGLIAVLKYLGVEPKKIFKRKRK